MTRFLVAGTLFLTACPSVPTITERQPQIVPASPVEDVSVHAVNTTHEFSVEVVAFFASTQIATIDVLNIDGEYFDAEALADNVAIAKDESAFVGLTYNPLKEGYHRAVVTITYATQLADENSTAQFEVRGRAVTPDARLWPWALDFGVVEPGEMLGSGTVTVTNDSELELVLSGAAFSSEFLETSNTFPVTVAALDSLTVDISYDPLVADAFEGTMILSVGSVLLPTVTLRANDCENGSPDAYDVDIDGFTSCGGDCLDDDDMAYPGAVEIEDGIDQDCDEIIDEETLGYDDDGDGFCDHTIASGLPCVDAAWSPGDCNDGDFTVNPDVEENFTNGVDDDCDGVVDFGTTDIDGDGYSADGGDCDDNDPDMFPDAPEVADGKDNDCDLVVDEGTIQYDDDGDGYCEHPTDCSDGSLPNDCNDNVVEGGFDTWPGAVEVPDWQDNNCDGTVDEGTENYDDDGDGFTEVGGDCDDDPVTGMDINPAQLEEPGNGIDEDCVDEVTD